MVPWRDFIWRFSWEFMHGQGWAGASYWVPNSTVLRIFSNSHLVVARNEKKFPILVSYHFICLFRQTYVLLETIWTERVISLNHKLVKCLKKRPPFLIVTSSLIRKSRTSFCQLDFFLNPNSTIDIHIKNFIIKQIKDTYNFLWTRDNSVYPWENLTNPFGNWLWLLVWK